MRYLILGSSGQIGNALVKHLKNKYHDVITYDIVHDSLQDLRVENRLFDFINQQQKIDMVYFLAFDVGGSRYLKKYQNTYDFISNNMKLMTNTFDTLSKLNLPFIFASSQMSNMDNSCYGILKNIGEKYTKSLNALVVKFWNVYGIENDLKKSHVITDFINQAVSSGKINMLTDGAETRQFLYADDCCECLEILASKYNDIDKNKNWHISNFKWNSIIDVANIIKFLIPGITIHPSINKDDIQNSKHNEPDENILKYWKPITSLESGILNIIQNIKNENK